jgi:hypothetical protein
MLGALRRFTPAADDSNIDATCTLLQMMAILGCITVTVIAIIIVVIVKNTT